MSEREDLKIVYDPVTYRGEVRASGHLTACALTRRTACATTSQETGQLVKGARWLLGCWRAIQITSHATRTGCD